jgi:hypothetical protein
MSANPADLFEQTFSWLQEHYAEFRFFTERDIVWTVQNRLVDLIRTAKVECRVYNDYPMLPGQRADIAIIENGIADVAVEFKYEPSHMRSGVDILSSKFPVVFWDRDGVGRDVGRIREFVRQGKIRVGYSVFIDEGGYFRHRSPHPGSHWLDWDVSIDGTGHVSILWSKVASTTSITDVL